MTRIEAYHILGEMYDETFSRSQAEALAIAQDDIQFVDLMPDDMIAVVRCKDCTNACDCGDPYLVCTAWGCPCDADEWCSRGKRREENAAD